MSFIPRIICGIQQVFIVIPVFVQIKHHFIDLFLIGFKIQRRIKIAELSETEIPGKRRSPLRIGVSACRAYGAGDVAEKDASVIFKDSRALAFFQNHRVTFLAFYFSAVNFHIEFPPVAQIIDKT